MFQVVTTVLKMPNEKHYTSKCIRKGILRRDDILNCARLEQSQIPSLFLNEEENFGHLVEKGPVASGIRPGGGSDGPKQFY
jgi:hypothetical protein